MNGTIAGINKELLKSLKWALSQLPEPKSAMSDESDISQYDEDFWHAEAVISEAEAAQ